MSLRLEPDDEISRFRKVWMGPSARNGSGAVTLPFQATYVAWGFFALFFTILAFLGAATPLPNGTESVAWWVVLSIAGSYLLSAMLDFDKPAFATLYGAIRFLLMQATIRRNRYRAKVAPATGRTVALTARPLKITRTPL